MVKIPRATPVVNGTKENVKNSDADAIILRTLSGERRVVTRDPPRHQPVSGLRFLGSRTRSVELHTYIVLAAQQDDSKGEISPNLW